MASIKTWPKNERPMERLQQLGVDTLSDGELLAILIGTGNPSRGLSPLDIGRALVERAGGIAGLEYMTANDMQQISGIGFVKCSRIRAALALACRLRHNTSGDKVVLAGAESVAAYLMPTMSHLRTEEFRMLALDNKSQLIAETTIGLGGTNGVVVHPREVFHPAIKHQATAIVVGHNHPSGDPSPSKEDIDLTRRLMDVGYIVGIPLLDHIIIGEAGKFAALSQIWPKMTPQKKRN